MQKTKTLAARKVAKVTVLSVLDAIRVKAGSTAKRVVSVAVNPVILLGLTQHADRPWRNAKVLRAKPRHVRKDYHNVKMEKISSLFD